MSRKFLTPIDLGQNELRNAVIQVLAADPGSPVQGQVWFNSTSKTYKYYDGTSVQIIGTGTGSGTVTSVSVATANGFAGTVATSTSTPAITLTTSVTGLLKGNGTAISAAVSNTDYAPVASPTFTGTVTVPTPTSSGAAATKGYVDGVAQGLSAKYAAVAATTGSETYTIASGSVTQIGGTTLDGQSPAVNDYVLVKDAPAASGTGSAGSSQPGNGLYQVTANSTNLTLSRAADMSGTNPPAGAYIFVEGGTAAAGAGYVVSTPSTSAAFTYGTGAIQFVQFTGAGEVTAGAGLSKSGNTLSVATGQTAGVMLKSNGATGFAAAKYTAAIGDGSSTSIAVTHSLGTRDVIVQIYDASTFATYECDVTRTSTSVVTLGFATAPASNSLNVVVIG